MLIHDDLGTRMKEFYENIPKTKLMRRTPVAIRVDGKAFHTFTRGLRRPFDEILSKSMRATMKYMCENIQGCVLGYTQSDEITFILVDYKYFDSDAWFDYEVEKVCSVSASMATMAFNKAFKKYADEMMEEYYFNLTSQSVEDMKEVAKYHETLLRAIDKGAMFDARCFNIPREEVTNLIYWRQLDATRNSIQMVGQAYFSHDELQYKSCNDIQDMLHEQKGINWNNYPTLYKRGSCCIKLKYDKVETSLEKMPFGEPRLKNEIKHFDGWYVDTEIPIFKGEGRKYIEDLIQQEEK